MIHVLRRTTGLGTRYRAYLFAKGMVGREKPVLALQSFSAQRLAFGLLLQGVPEDGTSRGVRTDPKVWLLG